MPRSQGVTVHESPEERWLREAQTARNLEALEAEQQGRWDEAIRLYERNAAEGFPGDWPYGRLVAIYEQQRAFDQAERILLRAIDVLAKASSRTPQDRRATVRVFRTRLTRLRRLRKAAETVESADHERVQEPGPRGPGS
jgi:hypothetical protein